MYPGQNERAGKRHSEKTRTGNRYLRDTLMQAALGARHKKDSALQARSHRVKRQRGHKRAVVAVGRHILEIAYYIMRDGVTDHELGATAVLVRKTAARCEDLRKRRAPLRRSGCRATVRFRFVSV